MALYQQQASDDEGTSLLTYSSTQDYSSGQAQVSLRDVTVPTTMMVKVTRSASSFESLSQPSSEYEETKNVETGFSSDEESGSSDLKSGLAEFRRTRLIWSLMKRNYKIGISCFVWYSSYMIMAVLGGTVAFMHFPRTNLPYPRTLPDFGYDIVPEWCPAIPHVPHGNVQSLCLLALYSIIWMGICCRWALDGKLILQQLLHLNTIVFLTRTTTVAVTGLPQPNPRCTAVQAFPVTYAQAWEFVIGRGFPPHACGDLIYSGHVACTLVCMTILHRHGYLCNRYACAAVWSISLLGIFATLSCRSHYSVDVILAVYFVFFIKEFYFLRSKGVVNGPIARIIQWLEDC